MNKNCAWIAALLLALWICLSCVTLAEDWQADLSALMDPEDVPQVFAIRHDGTEDESCEQQDVACEVTINGVVYGCEFTFDVLNAESDLSGLKSWLGEIITRAAGTAGGDVEALAKAIDQAVDLQTNADIALRLLRVSTPFYPELSVGKNGDSTKRLQQRLIELGFLQGTADGYFGEQTRAAVLALENFVRELEQDLIDNRPAETATPAPTATPTPGPTATPTPEPVSKHHLTLLPDPTATPTADPTATPTPAPTVAVVADTSQSALQPRTAADGVAEGLLQAYLYSDSFPVVCGTLQTGDSGSDVSRLQRRLAQLGCAAGEADGSYGATTARAVRAFQYANGLTQTGIADEATQQLLFSADAQRPQYEILSSGSTGDAVKTLQTRLKELGFTNASPDGDYGENTKTAIETLQTYMRDREIAVLRAYYGADADITDRITIEVNGIADPILQAEFYSEEFPAIPSQLQSGSNCDDVVRVQRRLTGLEYYEGSLDGAYGSQTEDAILRFQKRHGLTQTGVADTQTLALLFSGDAQKALKPYLIRVSTDDQRVYVYGLDDQNEYTVLVREMKCSTGKDSTPTPTGTYTSTTGPGARWHYFEKFDCWAQYAFYIQGDIMFHSVLYNEKEGKVTQSSVNNLGRKASHGCVRLSVEDAKWIYENCPSRTTVIVY